MFSCEMDDGGVGGGQDTQLLLTIVPRVVLGRECGPRILAFLREGESQNGGLTSVHEKVAL